MTNRLWPTDRVRICVKEHCRMRNLPYSSVTREEGLAVLASLAGCSISEMEAINPIHFVRLFLNDTQEDPIELIIKLCHLFGPYTYKGLATLYSQEYRLSSIPEVGEPSTPTNDFEDQTDVSDSIAVTLSEDKTDVIDSIIVTTSTSETVPEVVGTSERTITVVGDSNHPTTEPTIQRPQDPFVVPKSKAGCFFFRC